MKLIISNEQQVEYSYADTVANIPVYSHDLTSKITETETNGMGIIEQVSQAQSSLMPQRMVL